MDDRLKLRASDMYEYLERMARASEAVTYGELTPLYEDLPPAG